MPPKKKAKDKKKRVEDDPLQQAEELLREDGTSVEQSEETPIRENPFGEEANVAEMDEYLEGISDKSEKAKAAL